MRHGTTSRRAVLGGIATGAVVPAAGCTGGGAETVAVGPDGDLVFSPGTDEPLTVRAGTTVTFVWESDGHNVHVESGPDGADWSGHAAVEDEGFEHEHTFEVAGEYHYWCEPHRSQGMVGDVVVESGGGMY